MKTTELTSSAPLLLSKKRNRQRVMHYRKPILKYKDHNDWKNPKHYPISDRIRSDLCRVK